MLFSFALFGRIYGSLSQERLVHGMMMPTTGSPHWPLAVAFLGEALGVNSTPKEAADRVDKLIARHPGVGWGGTLDPPLQYLDTPHPDSWC
jgi:hypothetical protein